MKFTRISNDLLLTECNNFDPIVSCECGQCFRFDTIDGDTCTLYACGRALTVKRQENGWLFCDITEEEFSESFVRYFDLERDYSGIIASFSEDDSLSRAASSGSGIRIFRQDGWETLISFIISANNNIPRIKKIIDSLCRLYGEEENGYFSFPSPEKLYEVGIEGLAPIKAGFRAKYIYDAACKIVSGEVSLEQVATCGYAQALEELKKIKGVGDKVANCVLLFGFGYYEAFPIDVWVKRVIEKYYGEGFDPTVFGKYAGIAQQYLFYYERNVLAKEADE